MTQPQIHATTYTVSLLPLDHPSGQVWELKIEWTGNPHHEDRKWAVRWMDNCYHRNGDLEYEPLPSSRTEAWLNDHRFSWDEAEAFAVQKVQELTVNGLTAKEVLKREGAL